MISAEFVVERDDFLMDIKLEIPSTGATVLFGPSGSEKPLLSMCCLALLNRFLDLLRLVTQHFLIRK